MSKTFSMPGWRMGFAVGNERLISALTRVKSYLDYGAFTPIQVAATHALNGDGSDIAEVRNIYKRRRDVMVESFGKAGFEVPPPAATMFAWAKIPEKFRHLGSLEFSKLLVEKADVAVAPGIGFGEHGRRLCPHRAGRERTPHPPGGAQHQEVSLDGRRYVAQRHLAERSSLGRGFPSSPPKCSAVLGGALSHC